MMARLQLDQDLFSPIRFDTSFADSSNNSEESSASIELTSCFTNTPETEHNLIGLKSNEQRTESVSNCVQNMKLKESKISNHNSKASNQSSSIDSFNSTKFMDLKAQNVHKQHSKYKRDSKEHSKTSKDKGVLSKKKETVDDTTKVLDSCNQNNLKSIKPSRPISLALSKNKQTESSTLNESKKKDNKSLTKFSSSKNISNKEAAKESSGNSSDKNCQVSKRSVNFEKHVKAMKSECLSAEPADRKHRVPGTDFETTEPELLDQQLNLSRSTSNLPLHSQYEVSVEKMVHDYISFECDKIRQNMYTQQMYLYRQLNKIKDEMKQKHVVTTERLRKVKEKLIHIDMSDEN